MKKIIAAVVALAFTSTAGFAEVVCEPAYARIWDSYSNRYVTVRTPDRCFEAPAPQYYEPYPEPYYNDNGGAEFFMGALIGGLTGYAIGNYNDNNNYYYYNGNGNHYKKHRYRERNREWRREGRREHRRHDRQKNRNNP